MNFKNKYVNILVVGIILIIVYRFIGNIPDVMGYLRNFIGVFASVIGGAIIAFFLYRPINKLEIQFKKSNKNFIIKNSKVLSMLIVYLAIIAFIAIIITFVAPQLYLNIMDLINHAPEYYRTTMDFINKNPFLAKMDILEKITSTATSMMTVDNINKYISVISDVANSFITVLMSFIISVYMVLEKDAIFRFFSKLQKQFFNSEKASVVFLYASKISDLFYNYFGGMAIDAVAIGTVAAIVFAIFKVPYAILLGLMVAIGNMIPFFGPIIATIIVYLISAISLGPLKAIWTLVFLFVLGQTDANLIQPKIISHKVGIRPLLVLVSVTIFGNLFGAIGMILGVPICATLKMIVADYLDNQKLDGSAE